MTKLQNIKEYIHVYKSIFCICRLFTMTVINPCMHIWNEQLDSLPTITIFSLTFIYKSEIHNIFVNNESLHVKFAWGCACCLETVLQNENVFSFLFLSENMAQSYFFLFSAIHNRYISITAWYNIITAISTWT